MKNSNPCIPEESLFITTDTRKDRWAVPYNFDCLNARINTLMTNHGDAIQGKEILDIASHMGTFSFAALQLGAGCVHGVDAEAKMVEKCLGLFEYYHVRKTQYAFETGDVFQFLENIPEKSFDTVLCFGMLYYTTEPYRLLRLMRRAARDTILLDTFTAAYAAIHGKDALMIHPNIKDETMNLPLMLVTQTQTDKKDYRLPQSFRSGQKNLSLTSFPTGALLELWFKSLGMGYQRLDWSPYITRPCHWRNLYSPQQKRDSHWADIYASGVRVAYRLSVSPEDS
ncbi:MAG: class I SAM-dependent methyltransferase [Nitrospinales bacterium]